MSVKVHSSVKSYPSKDFSENVPVLLFLVYIAKSETSTVPVISINISILPYVPAVS